MADSRPGSFGSPLNVERLENRDLPATSFVLFGDDFNRMSRRLDPDWDIVAGSFRINGGAIVGSAPTNEIDVKGVAVTDVAVQVHADVRGAIGKEAGVIARRADANNMYWGTLSRSWRGYDVSIWSRVDGVVSRLAVRKAQSNGVGTLRLEVVGDSLRLFLNGALALQTTHSGLSHGGIGLRGTQGVRFDKYLASLIDATPPETTMLAAPPVVSRNRDATFLFSGTDGVTTQSKLKYQISLDGAPLQSSRPVIILNELTDGIHKLAASAVDEAGNIDPTPATFEWLVDTSTPILSASAVATDDFAAGVSIRGRVVDSGSGIRELKATFNDGTSQAVEFNPLTGEFSLDLPVNAPLAEVKLTAADQAGNCISTMVEVRAAVEDALRKLEQRILELEKELRMAQEVARPGIFPSLRATPGRKEDRRSELVVNYDYPFDAGVLWFDLIDSEGRGNGLVVPINRDGGTSDGRWSYWFPWGGWQTWTYKIYLYTNTEKTQCLGELSGTYDERANNLDVSTSDGSAAVVAADPSFEPYQDSTALAALEEVQTRLDDAQNRRDTLLAIVTGVAPNQPSARTAVPDVLLAQAAYWRSFTKSVNDAITALEQAGQDPTAILAARQHLSTLVGQAQLDRFARQATIPSRDRREAAVAIEYFENAIAQVNATMPGLQQALQDAYAREAHNRAALGMYYSGDDRYADQYRINEAKNRISQANELLGLSQTALRGAYAAFAMARPDIGDAPEISIIGRVGHQLALEVSTPGDSAEITVHSVNIRDYGSKHVLTERFERQPGAPTTYVVIPFHDGLPSGTYEIRLNSVGQNWSEQSFTVHWDKGSRELRLTAESFANLTRRANEVALTPSAQEVADVRSNALALARVIAPSYEIINLGTNDTLRIRNGVLWNQLNLHVNTEAMVRAIAHAMDPSLIGATGAQDRELREQWAREKGVRIEFTWGVSSKIFNEANKRAAGIFDELQRAVADYFDYRLHLKAGIGATFDMRRLESDSPFLPTRGVLVQAVENAFHGMYQQMVRLHRDDLQIWDRQNYLAAEGARLQNQQHALDVTLRFLNTNPDGIGTPEQRKASALLARPEATKAYAADILAGRATGLSAADRAAILAAARELEGKASADPASGNKSIIDRIASTASEYANTDPLVYHTEARKIRKNGDTLTPMTPESLTKIARLSQKARAAALTRGDSAEAEHWTKLLEAAEGMLKNAGDPKAAEWIEYIERTTSDPLIHLPIREIGLLNGVRTGTQHLNGNIAVGYDQEFTFELKATTMVFIRLPAWSSTNHLGISLLDKKGDYLIRTEDVSNESLPAIVLESGLFHLWIAHPPHSNTSGAGTNLMNVNKAPQRYEVHLTTFGSNTSDAQQLREELTALWESHRQLSVARDSIVTGFRDIGTDIDRRETVAKLGSLLVGINVNLAKLAQSGFDGKDLKVWAELYGIAVDPAINAGGIVSNSELFQLLASLPSKIQLFLNPTPVGAVFFLYDAMLDLTAKYVRLKLTQQQIEAMNQVNEAIHKLNGAILARQILLQRPTLD